MTKSNNCGGHTASRALYDFEDGLTETDLRNSRRTDERGSHGRSARYSVSEGRGKRITVVEVSKSWVARPSVVNSTKMSTLNVERQWI
jgi:hypothetical protein